MTTIDHVAKFSGPFYESLDRGRSVEGAVQAARIELFDRAPSSPASVVEKDHAAFGAVSVVTTAEGNIRLLTAPSTDDPRPPTGARSVHSGPGGPGPVGAPTAWAPPASAAPPAPVASAFEPR